MSNQKGEKVDYDPAGNLRPTGYAENYRSMDPSIPSGLRRQLVSELTSGRRAMGRARKSGDHEAQLIAERRITCAKIALGEQGPKWWTSMSETDWSTRTLAAICSLLRSRKHKGSVSFLEIATIVDGAQPRNRIAMVKACAEKYQQSGIFLITKSQCDDGLRPDSRFRLERGAQFDTFTELPGR